MLRSLKQSYGDKSSTQEGEFGRVRDFYFDDQQWAVRYVVVDTGEWLPRRLVLISPHAFGSFHREADCMLANLTPKQIKNSPPIESHEPVSRQYEEEYFRYYGWPDYWSGSELWGGASYPAVPPPAGTERKERGGSCTGNDPHLKSTKSVAGYHVHTRDGSIGNVRDFLIDDRTWAIRHMVVETGHWYFGKEVVISPGHIERISYYESTIFVNVTRAAIHDAPDYRMPRARYHDARAIDEPVQL